MAFFSTPSRYGAVTQSFHWITVLLVGAAYILAEGGPEARVYASDRAFGLGLHETLGLLVFISVALRLFWRMLDRVPRNPVVPAWMNLSALVIHWALYILLFAVPLTAVIGAWLEGHPVTFAG